jgi:hypothetical protein
MNRNHIVIQPQSRKAIVAGAVLLAWAVLGSTGCDLHHKSKGSRYVSPVAPFVLPPDPSGAVVTESRAVQGFNAVSMESVGIVVVEHSGAESLAITAEETLLPYLTSEVSGDTLVLGSDLPDGSRQASAILFEVGVMSLDRVAFSGVGGIDARGIDTRDFRALLTGVGDIQVEGRVDRQEVDISGVGAYRAADLSSRTAVVNMSGVNQAVVRVSERLEGFVVSPCVLEYYGDPVVAISGGGTVRRLGP